MSGLVPDLLSARYLAASQTHGALLLKALSTELSKEIEAAEDGADARDAGLRWLLRMPAARLVGRSTPFVWLNVHRLARCSEYKHPSAVAFARYLSMTAFDAYFHDIPDGTRVALKAVPGTTTILLPRLAVQLTTGCCNSILERRGPTALAVSTPQGCLHFDLGAIQSAMRLGVAVPFESAARVLSVRDLALFEAPYIEQIKDGPADGTFLEAVSKALQFIATVDQELEARISSITDWYVQISSPKDDVHCSFTSPQLKGVIFLSNTQNELQMAEAIVHEFGHTELNTLMDTEMLSSEDTRERFYSPWRSDPRPLSGLIHALYVFSRVSEFLSRAAAHPSMAARFTSIQAQRTTIYHRLRIGLKQVPLDKLTPLGTEVIEDISLRLKRQADVLGADNQDMPDHIRAHLAAWKVEHSELASAVKMA
jgi:HEXXH motif-containing protein